MHDPATDEVWAHVESMDENDTDLAIAAADRAFPAYSALPARKRARMILELDRLFRAAKSDLAQLIVMESGKALPEAEAEVEYAGEVVMTGIPLRILIGARDSDILLVDGWRV